jgi:hypothetical protein
MSEQTTPAGDETAAAAAPFLTVVKGNPTDVEVAALVGVLAAASGSGEPADPGPRNLWGSHTDRLRPAGGLSPTAFPNLRWDY